MLCKGKAATKPDCLIHILSRPTAEQLTGAVRSLIAVTDHPPANASEAIKLWDWIAEQHYDSRQLQEVFTHITAGRTSLDLLVELSQPREGSRRKRKDVLRLFYHWKVWPWDLIDTPNSPEYSKDFLAALVALAQQAGDNFDLGVVRSQLRLAYDTRRTRGGRRTNLEHLTVSDIRATTNALRLLPTNLAVQNQNEPTVHRSVTLRRRKTALSHKANADTPKDPIVSHELNTPEYTSADEADSTNLVTNGHLDLQFPTLASPRTSIDEDYSGDVSTGSDDNDQEDNDECSGRREEGPGGRSDTPEISRRYNGRELDNLGEDQEIEGYTAGFELDCCSPTSHSFDSYRERGSLVSQLPPQTQSPPLGSERAPVMLNGADTDNDIEKVLDQFWANAKAYHNTLREDYCDLVRFRGRIKSRESTTETLRQALRCTRERLEQVRATRDQHLLECTRIREQSSATKTLKTRATELGPPGLQNVARFEQDLQRLEASLADETARLEEAHARVTELDGEVEAAKLAVENADREHGVSSSSASGDAMVKIEDALCEAEEVLSFLCGKLNGNVHKRSRR